MNNAISEVFEPEGRAIQYATTGSGAAIVLLPGGSLNISYLEPLAMRLADGGLRAVRIGTRTPLADPDAQVTMHDLARDVVDVMDHLGIQSSWIAGHAFGNRVARAVALDHPGRIDGVVLLAAGGTVPPSAEAAHALQVSFSDVTQDEAIGAMDYFVGDPKDSASAWAYLKPARDFHVGAMQRDAVMNTPQEEWARLVPGMRVLIVQGTKDQIAPPANGEQLAQEYPGQVTLAWVEGGGHLFSVIHPNQTATAIVQYVVGPT